VGARPGARPRDAERGEHPRRRHGRLRRRF
jgi:hypothetical protein